MSQKYNRPAIDHDKLKNNPFTSSLKIKVVKRTDKSRYVEEEGLGYFNKDYLMEKETPTRVYVSPKRRALLNRLNPNASKLLGWCVQELEVNRDYVWVNKDRYMEETGIAYNTYRKAVDQLQDMGFILKSSIKDVFWVNPEFCFRGNRIAFYGKKKGVISVERDLSDNGN